MAFLRSCLVTVSGATGLATGEEVISGKGCVATRHPPAAPANPGAAMTVSPGFAIAQPSSVGVDWTTTPSSAGRCSLGDSFDSEENGVDAKLRGASSESGVLASTFVPS
jgi:hypothetical protein